MFGTLGALLADPTAAAGHTVERLAARLIPSLAAALDPTGRAGEAGDRRSGDPNPDDRPSEE